MDELDKKRRELADFRKWITFNCNMSIAVLRFRGGITRTELAKRLNFSQSSLAAILKYADKKIPDSDEELQAMMDDMQSKDKRPPRYWNLKLLIDVAEYFNMPLSKFMACVEYVNTLDGAPDEVEIAILMTEPCSDKRLSLLLEQARKTAEGQIQSISLFSKHDSKGNVVEEGKEIKVSINPIELKDFKFAAPHMYSKYIKGDIDDLTLSNWLVSAYSNMDEPMWLTLQKADA